MTIKYYPYKWILDPVLGENAKKVVIRTIDNILKVFILLNVIRLCKKMSSS